MRVSEVLVCSCGAIGNAYGMKHTWWCRNLTHPDAKGNDRRWAPA